MICYDKNVPLGISGQRRSPTKTYLGDEGDEGRKTWMISSQEDGYTPQAVMAHDDNIQLIILAAS